MFETNQHINFLFVFHPMAGGIYPWPFLFHQIKKQIKMKTIDIDQSLNEIGRSMLRVMAYQATVRVTGSYDMAKENGAYADMLLATRTAGKLLRSLAGAVAAKDSIAEDALKGLLNLMDPAEITSVIKHMNDGHLALIITEPTGI